MIQPVPAKFQPIQINGYPPDNIIDFEHWMAKNVMASEFPPDLVYLPICWTAFYVNANYGRTSIKLAELNRFIRALDKTKKYWTVVQYDDGIISTSVKDIDLKVFSMVNGTKDHPIPLLCYPHKTKLTKFTRPIFANFVGATTHRIRESMLTALPKNAEYYVSTKRHDMTMYSNVIANSTFTLCPRGYGPTSFRIMEAIHLKSIPVYISDYFVEPFGIDFDLYGVKIQESEIKNIDQILRSVDVAKKKTALLHHQHLYTYEGSKNEIIKTLNVGN